MSRYVAWRAQEVSADRSAAHPVSMPGNVTRDVARWP